MQLMRIWRKKLAESGFRDIEHENGNLQFENRNTRGWQNMEVVRDFFLNLDHWLYDNADTIPKRDLAILELFSAGTHITGPNSICERLKLSSSTVRNTIRVYKRMFISPRLKIWCK